MAEIEEDGSTDFYEGLLRFLTILPHKHMATEETCPYFQCLIYIRSQFRERNTEIPIEKFRSHVLSSNTMTVLYARQQSGSQKFTQNFH